ncbi:hypothetical protein SAMN05444385_10429 [Tritonibacter mobilis]|nr:hypothetical protein SAMN05444385_10429 [Tritonibacter mobilis]
MDALRAATEPGWALLPSILNEPSRPSAASSPASTMPMRPPWGRVGCGQVYRPGRSFRDLDLPICLDKQDQKKLNIDTKRRSLTKGAPHRLRSLAIFTHHKLPKGTRHRTPGSLPYVDKKNTAITAG